MDAPGVCAVPAFLVGRPSHFQLCTPELVKAFRAVVVADWGPSCSNSRVNSLTAEEAADAPPTALAASLGTTCGSRRSHKLEECRTAAVALRHVTHRTQKAFWLMDRTAGRGPLTYQQLLLLEEGAL